MKKNIYLFQPQYAVEFRKETTYWIPYSVGCIWSYVNQYPDIQENFVLADLFFSREEPKNIIDRMQDPVICGFSCYVWNTTYCFHMAKLIKSKWPNCVIVFGGPQIAKKDLEQPFIDCVVMGEGEENFLEILRDMIKDETVETFYNKKRLDFLDIPSPYTTGVFDDIIKRNPDALWAVTFETNRGCPYSCTFCDWGSVTHSKIKKFLMDRIESDLMWMIGKPVTYAFCADANFGIFKERDLEIAKILKRVADQSLLDAVNIQYAKNSTEVVFEIARVLGDISRGVTVSVQSMHEPTLTAIKRKNMQVNNIQDLMVKSEEYGVITYTEVILGLPEETLDSWKKGFTDLLEMGQHQNIDMWLAQLLRNSELSQPETIEKYGIKSIDSKDYMNPYNKNDCKDIVETITLIQSTNTMSVEDMIDGYMYGWMIIHFHISGYSQIISKQLRAQGISYAEYYNKLFESISSCPDIHEHFCLLRDTVSHYLRTGLALENDQFVGVGHVLHSASYDYMYANKQKIIDFVFEVSQSLYLLPDHIKQLQYYYIFDKDHNYPIKINNHVITPKDNFGREFDLYAYRRKGLLKNIISNS